MTVRHLTIRLGGLALALLVVGASRTPAQVTPDPYSPWNAMYRPFVFPNTYSSPALPNQARLPYLAEGADRYSTGVDVFGTFDPNLFDMPARIGGRGVPYYQTFRNQRAAAEKGFYDRSYVPNRGDTFYEDQAVRQQRLIDARASRNPRDLTRAAQDQERFFRAMRERNPQRRAKLLSQLEAGRGDSATADGDPGAATERTTPPPGEAAFSPPRLPSRSGTRPVPPSTGGLDLLRPLSSSGVPPARGRSDLDAELSGSSRRTLPPPTRFPVPPEIENILEPPGGASGRRLPGIPPAPEPR